MLAEPRPPRDGGANGYANSSVCSPTRFAIATGRWQHRLRGAADEPIASASASPVLGLPPEHPTQASLMRDAGYTTALIGKWHLGRLPHFGPLKSGYQEFFGFMGGAVDYFNHVSPGGHDLWDGEEEVYPEGHLTDLLTERAVAFVKNQRDKPFLLSLHFNAPHWPWETRDDKKEADRIQEKIAHIDGGSVKIYLEMIREMDEGIGRVLAALDEMLEGGIRVPYIVRWPDRLPAGKTTDQLAISMDWVATALSAAGVSPHRDYPLDGIDLLGKPVERNLYWRMTYRQQKAMRSGVWKYLSIEGNEFLYDLSYDPRERANLRYRNPEKFKELRADFARWNATMPPLPAVQLVYTDETMARSAG